MLEELFAPVFKFFSSLGQPDENEKVDAILRPYIGKILWLAVAPDRSKVLFTARTPRRLEKKARMLGVGANDFISVRAPRKHRRM